MADLTSVESRIGLTNNITTASVVDGCTKWEVLDVWGVPKEGVSNERFSAKVKFWRKLDIHTVILSASVYLRRRVGLQCFQEVT